MPLLSLNRLFACAFLLFTSPLSAQNVPDSDDCFETEGQTVCRVETGNSYGLFHIIKEFKVADEEPRKIIIFVPHSYFTGSSARYPVSYFFDGQSIFFPDNFMHKSWKLSETLADLKSRNEIQDFISVAMYPLERNKEYTHAHVHFQPCCGLKDHSEYVASVIKPFIDRTYRTLSDRANTSIIGSSHGGLAAFYTGTRHSEKFGTIASLSPSFWVGLFPVSFYFSLENSSLISELKENVDFLKNKPRIFLSWGLIRSGGYHNSFIERLSTRRSRQMTNILVQKFRYDLNNELMVLEDPVGHHDEDTWAGLLPGVIKWIYQK